MTDRALNEDRDSWRVEIELPDRACIPEFEAVLETLGGAVTSREIDNGPRWHLIAHCAEQPDRAALETHIAAAAASVGMLPPSLSIELVPATDWVSEYQRRTPPVTAGGFFIYPSHYAGGVPAGLTGIRLDAGLAFGTGEHETTLGCLQALEDLEKQDFPVVRALDMGCGSAILAIAVAHLWPESSILAVDNDPVAVRTASDNVIDNGCASAVRVVDGDGYRAEGVADGTPFDLIVANILARPLIAMAPDAATHLVRGGTVVLSGILSEQADSVMTAYCEAGLTPLDRRDIANWSTLVLTNRSSTIV